MSNSKRSKTQTRVFEDRLSGVFEVMSNELKSKDKNDEITSFAISRLDNRMWKRAEIHTEGLSQLALQSFQEINERVRVSRVSIPADDVSNARYFITSIFERFNTSVDDTNIQRSLDLNYLFENWRFGPGASNGIKGTHTAEKISLDMTCTSSSVPLVLQLRRNNLYLTQNDLKNKSLGFDVIEGSRLTTVPKNRDTDRTIAIEPSGNMALQLAAGRYMENVLRMIGLDISTQQSRNKDLAKRGSVDNSIATIDLKSASDMISIDLVRLLMPSEWYELLMKLRSPVTAINGTNVQLAMISTMGNGFTFPLMTLLIVALIYAFRCRTNGPTLFVDWSSTAVFGDDIIIPTHEYAGFCELLAAAGLVVNHDKSFSDGPFRESCGGDYYKGFDVTPFYVRSLRTNSDVYVAINQVLEWCAKMRIILYKTLMLLRSFVDGKPFIVPEWHNPDQGILSASVEKRYKYLQPVLHTVVLKDHHFGVMLACGGYISPQGPDVVYAPRPLKTRVSVRRARLPKGYPTGHDPIKRSFQISSFISTYVDLIFTDILV